MITIRLFVGQSKNLPNEAFNDGPLGLILLRFKENGPSLVVGEGDVNEDEN